MNERITEHHLYPKVYRNKIARPNKGPIPGRHEKMKLCRTCHSTVHRAKTNYELAEYYNTKEKINELLSEIKFGVLAERQGTTFAK